MSSGSIGTSMSGWQSYGSNKRAAKRRATETKRWNKLNGPVITREATKEELSRFRKPRIRKPP